MTAAELPTALAYRDEGTLAGILARLGGPGGHEAFRRQVLGVGGCRRPVRLRGRTADAPGEVVFDTDALPEGVLLKACGTRRESLCPPCASLYRSDAFHLVASGLRGGKGVGEEVAERPAVFLTLTAPSFGAVHRRRPDGRCRPAGTRCPHGRALICSARHHEDDPLLGQALCPHCYDFDQAVLFNASVAELWRRTTIYGLRSMAGLVGCSVRRAEKTWRLSYLKVVEFQRRGSVHLHALVRLDLRADDVDAPDVDAAVLRNALLTAARKVSAPCPGTTERRLRWGTQLEAAVVGDTDDARRRAASYCAKYATKGVLAGGALDRRLRAGVPQDLELPRHLRRLVDRAWLLGSVSGLSDLGLRRWAHTCGFRGHVLTKSRRYSTTFRALRAARLAWVLAQAGLPHEPPAEAEWSFVGVGYVTIGDACLAAGVEEELRLGRRVAYEERRRHRRGA